MSKSDLPVELMFSSKLYTGNDMFMLKFEKEVYLGNGLLFITPIRTKNVSYMLGNIFCYMMTFDKFAVLIEIQYGRRENVKNNEFGCATFSNLKITNML